MKYTIGTIIVLIILSAGVYFLANLWGYDALITYEELKKIAMTIMAVGVVFLLLLILVPFFFKDHAKGYDKNHSRITQPKQSVKK